MRDHELAEAIGQKWAAAFQPAEPVEPEPEPEPPSKGNVIPSAGQAPGYESYPAINELVNPTDKYAQLLKLIDQNNNR